jgi:N-acetylglucosaminyldiphosphoundecaprenol N-acetyl-beta-D-mannosaminyltransferase
MGDLVLTTPAIAAIREAHPHAHLALLVAAQNAKVLEGSAFVDEIITFERVDFNSSIAIFKPKNLRRIFQIGQFDTVIFFHHFTFKLGTLKFALIALAARAKRRIGLQNGHGWFLTHSLPDYGFGVKHQAQYWLDLASVLFAKSDPLPASVPIGSAPIPKSDRPRVVIHAGSGGYSLARRWDPESFARLGDQLASRMQVVLVGGQNDDSGQVKALMQQEAIDLSGKTTVTQLTAVLQDAALFIGSDSGVMHLAAAVGTPVVAIFGPSNHAAYGPWTIGGKSIVVRSAPECSPCSYVGHGIGLRHGCEARTCMRMVTVEQVIQAADELLSRDTVTPAVKTLSLPPIEKTAWIKAGIKRVNLLGVPVAAITYEQLLDLIGVWVEKGERLHHICTTNPEFLVIAQRDPNFFNILNRADLCIPDGIGLIYGAQILGERLPQRVTGSDGVPLIAERAAQRGWRVFLLGAAPGVAEKTAQILMARYPGLQIVGTYAGSPHPSEEDAIVNRVNQSEADVLFVAYGAPQQDKWIARNHPRLQVKLAMGVGGAFDFIAGILPRAPEWMRQLGIEWLYRLYLQPTRIGRMMRLPLFVLLILGQWVRTALKRRESVGKASK